MSLILIKIDKRAMSFEVKRSPLGGFESKTTGELRESQIRLSEIEQAIADLKNTEEVDVLLRVENEEYLQELEGKHREIKDEIKKLEGLINTSDELLKQGKKESLKMEEQDMKGVKEIEKIIRGNNKSPEAERARLAGKFSAAKRTIENRLLPEIEDLIYQKKDKLEESSLTDEKRTKEDKKLSDLLERVQDLTEYETLDDLQKNILELEAIEEKLEHKGIE